MAAATGPQVAAGCAGTASLTNLRAKVGGVTKPLQNRVIPGVAQGGTVEALFDVRKACGPVTVSLVSYKASGPAFVRADAAKQKVSGSVTKTFPAGPGSLSVAVPNCYFQVDLVVGAVRTSFGAPGSADFYGAEKRLVGHATGGTKICPVVQGVKIVKPPKKPVVEGVKLPSTGAPIVDMMLLGLLGMGSGVVLCVAGRRSWYERHGETF
jgi:hypothetical protein